MSFLSKLKPVAFTDEDAAVIASAERANAREANQIEARANAARQARMAATIVGRK